MAMTEDEIIDYTARTEGGSPLRTHNGTRGPDAPYDAWNSNDAGAGISFGCIQFNQAGGRKAGKPGSPLALMFQACQKASPDKWAAIMGPYADSLVDSTWVKQADLNAPDLKSRILATARDPDFRQAQRDQARTAYFVPAKKIAGQFDITSARGLAMLFDGCVQMGPATTKNLMAAANGDLASFAAAADARSGSTRRTRMLSDPGLNDDAPDIGLSTSLAVAFAPSVPDSEDEEDDSSVGVDPTRLFLAGMGVAALALGGYMAWKHRDAIRARLRGLRQLRA